jgi:transcriptional regulator with GAF, ATPase, and Fis domain/uncharacterized protein HemY
MNSKENISEIDYSQLEKQVAESLEICRNDPQKGIDLADEVLRNSEIKSTKINAKALACKGACQVWLGDYENALKNLFEALQQFESNGDSVFEGHTLYHLFCAFYYLADYDNSLKYALEMLNRAEKNSDVGAQANALNGIGSVYYTTGENEKAIEALSKGLAFAEKLEDKHLLARILDGLGSAYFNINDIERAIIYMEQSLETARPLRLKNEEAFALDGLARIYFAAGAYKISEKLFLDSLSIREEINFKSGIAETNMRLGELFMKTEVYDKALKHLNAALAISTETNTKEVIYKTHEALSNYYEKHANTERFIAHYKNYFAYKEEYFSEKNKQKLKGVEMQTSISQMEKEKALLSEKNKQLELLSNDLVVLSDLGKTITSQLTIESINSTVYKIINNMMDAPGFGIGVLSDNDTRLTFPGYIEKGVVLRSSGYDLSDNNRLAPICFNKEIEIIINDYDLEAGRYLQKKLDPVVGESVQSIIYLPLRISDKKTGVITVQSFNKNAYSEYQVNLVKNLAIYCAIAIGNATMYEQLEERVADRTKEVVQQKEEIEKAQEKTRLLNVIGQQLISNISFESIFEKLHENVSKLMNADCFSIRIYNPEKREINYKYSFEKGKLMIPITVSMDNIDNYSVWCVTNKKEIFINDNVNEYQKYTSKIVVPRGEMPSSLLFCPMMIGERITGVITVQSFSKNAYIPSDMDVLKTLGTYTAIALENAHLVEHLEEKVSEVIIQKEEIEKSHENTRLLSEIGQQIISNVNFNSIFRNLHENVSRLMNADCFGIRIYHERLNEIEYRFEIEKGELMQPLTVSMSNDDNFSVWCVKNKKEIFINDNINEHHKYTKKIVVPTGDMTHSLLFCPMMIGERVVGVITVQSFEKNAYVPHHIDVLKTLGTYTAIALENANWVEHLEDKVKERTTEVVKQKEIIEETNKHITDSIKYAKRIQEAFLPSEKSINDLLKNAFILYKPKDIVSGDFYWIERKENKILFAVVDCTGHGVPGAFMSIIGFNGLNQIVNEYNYTRPADILTHLNKSISNTLKQHVDDSKIRDGMDVAICSIDLENNKLEFAGAFSPLFILRNNEVLKFKGDKHPIGNFVGVEEYEFTNNEIDLLPDDKIYIFSDGFVDQFGGPNGKKLKYNYFRKLLLDNHKKPMPKQKEAINTFFEEWRTGFEQIDDVCIIGVAI